jgi:hypothetical protein
MALDSTLQLTFKNYHLSAAQLWLTTVILATWEAKIWRIVIQDQPGQTVHETPIFKITRAKWTGGVAQAIECQL